MNDRPCTEKRVFISHKSRDKYAATVIDGILRKAGGANLKVFLSERIEPGVEWSNEIWEKVKKADWLILLYTDPSDEWDWCLFEAGFFAGGGKTGLICLHTKDVIQPKPLQQWQSVHVNDEDEMEQFLKTLLTDLNPALVESKEDLRKLIVEIGAAFIRKVRRKLDSEWNTEFVIISFKNPAQVKMLKETGRISNDVSCGEEVRESLDIFGHRTGECTIETIQDGLNIYERSWWMKCLGEALRAAALKRYPIPPIPRIVSPYTGKEYQVVLHRMDRFNDDTLSFCLLFIEIAPENAEEKDRQLKFAANMLTIGRQFRWNILTKYHRDVTILKVQQAREEKIRECLEDLNLRIAWIRGEVERIDVITEDDIIALFEDENDKKKISKLLKELWPEVFQRLSNEIVARDLDGVLHTLTEMLKLNKDFMIMFADKYLGLWKKVN